jgi:hypothetical protein
MLFFMYGDAESYKLVEDLSDNSFMVRQKSHEKLLQMEHKALRALELGYDSRNPETRIRCEKILEQYYNIQPRKGSMPAIYCLSGPVKGQYLKELRNANEYGSNLEFYAHYDKLANDSLLPCNYLIGLTCHWYTAKQLRNEGKSYWCYQYCRECETTELLCKDLLFLGISKPKVQDLLEYMQKRYNSLPRDIKSPPKWLLNYYDLYAEIN